MPPKVADPALDDLVANRTLSAAMARTLAVAASERQSFLVCAVPRLAGKTTLLHAMLANVPGGTAIHTVAGDAGELARITAKDHGAYLVVPEISRAPVPGYIWGAPVRRVFAALRSGLSLATAMHTDGPEGAFDLICRGNRVPDEDAARLHLVVYIRSLGEWQAPTRRVVATIHQVTGVRDGRPRTRLLHRWDEARDRFETLSARG